MFLESICVDLRHLRLFLLCHLRLYSADQVRIPNLAIIVTSLHGGFYEEAHY